MVDKEKQKIKKATLAAAEAGSDDGEAGGQLTTAATPAKVDLTTSLPAYAF